MKKIKDSMVALWLLTNLIQGLYMTTYALFYGTFYASFWITNKIGDYKRLKKKELEEEKDE